MIYRQDGKKWDLPDVLRFSDPYFTRGYFFYTVEYRCPRAGEWFLSGAIVEAYKTNSNLTTKYLVATPTDKAKKVTTWVKA